MVQVLKIDSKWIVAKFSVIPAERKAREPESITPVPMKNAAGYGFRVRAAPAPE
jgi:hypothetical protein